MILCRAGPLCGYSQRGFLLALDFLAVICNDDLAAPERGVVGRRGPKTKGGRTASSFRTGGIFMSGARHCSLWAVMCGRLRACRFPLVPVREPAHSPPFLRLERRGADKEIIGHDRASDGT